jgi:hypothetical protein
MRVERERLGIDRAELPDVFGGDGTDGAKR